MPDAIFLSASVPDPMRGAEYAKTADSVAISAAVSALVYVTLGRRKLVWGGHPAITPMVWIVAESLGVDYGKWVQLYQTNHFKDVFPEANARFQNVTYTEDQGDREKSLRVMREKMFKDNCFQSAVFIGGMQGIIDEFKMFSDMQPKANIIPVVSTGGAVLNISKLMPDIDEDLENNLDYIALFHKHLHISEREKRYPHPDLQPEAVEDRYWRSESK